MKRIRNIIKSSALVGAFCLLLTANGWSKDGKLTDIARPYLGTYECETLYFGGENKLDDFDYFRLEIASDGTMKLVYKAKNKDPKEIPLKYEYNSDKQEITVRGQWGIVKSQQTFPLKNGELNATLRFGGKQIIVKFKK